jgi:uncharacterized protein with GYD domain
MVHYFVRAAYKPEAVAALAKSPQNRVEAVSAVVRRLGGTLEAGGLLFGDVDLQLVAICSLPDNVTAAALAIAISTGGMVASVRTTPLLSGTEGLEALAKAANAGYRPPGL